MFRKKMEHESNNVEGSTSALPFAKRMLGEDLFPTEIQNYLSTYNIEFGKYYSYRVDGPPMQLTDYKFHPYWQGYMLLFGKVGFRISLPFTWFEVEAINNIETEIELIVDDRKPKDNDYYLLKKEHELLCKKKLELFRQGKNTLMRNAYINQNLDVLREKLSKYK